MDLGEDDLGLDECAELNDVVLVVHSHFNVKRGQWIFLDDGHDQVVSCELAAVKWAESSLEPVAADLTVFGQIVHCTNTEGVGSHFRAEGLSVAGCDNFFLIQNCSLH